MICGKANSKMFRSVSLRVVVGPPLGVDVFVKDVTNMLIVDCEGSVGTMARLADCETLWYLPATSGPKPAPLPPSRLQLSSGVPSAWMVWSNKLRFALLAE